MELFVKHFSELTAQELFEIYRLRVSVFVVEQKCCYQEVDDADKDAYITFGCGTRTVSRPTRAFCRAARRSLRFLSAA